jgi:hypothetical protein
MALDLRRPRSYDFYHSRTLPVRMTSVGLCLPGVMHRCSGLDKYTAGHAGSHNQLSMSPLQVHSIELIGSTLPIGRVTLPHITGGVIDGTCTFAALYSAV